MQIVNPPIWLFLCYLLFSFYSRADNELLDSMADSLPAIDTFNENSLKSLEKIFEQTDELLKHTKIQYQSIDSIDNLGTPHITSLLYFMSGPYGFSTLSPLIINLTNNPKIFDDFDANDFKESISLHELIGILWNHQKITDEEAHQLIKFAPLSTQELLRLIENGIVRTSKNLLIKLKTGSIFGDPLGLFHKIDNVLLRVYKHRPNMDLSVENVKIPLQPELDKEFEKDGIIGNEAIFDGQLITKLRRHFIFISSIGIPIRFGSNHAGFNPRGPGSPVVVNAVDSIDTAFLARNLTAMITTNNFFPDSGTSLTNTFLINPIGLSYSGNFASSSGHGFDYWLFFSEAYLGSGLGYTVNFDQGTFWSSGSASYLSMGLAFWGWRNNFGFGASLQTIMNQSIAVGVNASVNISENNHVTYLEKYPMDGKFAELRGLHKIEVEHDFSLSGMVAGTINLSALDVPISIGLRGGAELTRDRVFRTHVTLNKAQEMLLEDDIPGVLMTLRKKINHSAIPGFEQALSLKVGDELIERKICQLSGAFVIGIEAMAVNIPAGSFGATTDLKAEFEIGVRMLENRRMEVSIEPTEIIELGLFASTLNLAGIGYIHAISLARKQIFLFDLNKESAVQALENLIIGGQLPSSEELDISPVERGPEYLLSSFRAINEELKSLGVQRTYLEKVRISSDKIYAGISAPIIPAILFLINKADKKIRKGKHRIDLSFEGIERTFISAQGTCVATNGVTAVTKHVRAHAFSEGQGTSGLYGEEALVTHSRVHWLTKNGNAWRFNDLKIRGTISDTKITGNEENIMAHKINKLFNAGINKFSIANAKNSRVVTIERELTATHLYELLGPNIKQRIVSASQASGISTHRITLMLEALPMKNLDEQALIVKQFIESSDGLSGFSAIHHLLGAQPEDLYILTQSGYLDVVNQTKKFIVLFSDNKNKNDTPKANIALIRGIENKKHIKHFYEQARTLLRDIDWQLRLLYDDQYLWDKNQPNLFNNKMKQLVESGVRQDKSTYKTALVSIRKNLLELMDLKSQGFSIEERMKIYKIAKNKLRLEEYAEYLLYKINKDVLNPLSPRDTITALYNKRYKLAMEMIIRIDNRLEEISKDESMEFMDHDYFASYTKTLRHLRREFQKVIDLSAINPSVAKEILANYQSRPLRLRDLIFNKAEKEFRLKQALEKRANSKTRKKSKSISHQRSTSVKHLDRKIKHENNLRSNERPKTNLHGSLDWLSIDGIVSSEHIVEEAFN